MNNSVGYAKPSVRQNRIILGTDGIGADMLEEFRIAYVRHREFDLTATPESAWQWLQDGQHFFPEASKDCVRWSYDHVDSPWHVAFTPGLRATDVYIDGEQHVSNGKPLKFDIEEIRTKAAEAARRLHERL